MKIKSKMTKADKVFDFLIYIQYIYIYIYINYIYKKTNILKKDCEPVEFCQVYCKPHEKKKDKNEKKVYKK